MTVLVVGDSMVDRYWMGTSTRPNPDGPQPLVAVEKVVTCPGGAANVARNLKMLGVDFVEFLSGKGTIVKNRVVNSDKVVLRFDEGSRLAPIDPLVAAIVGRVDAVVVADYGKGSITEPLVQIIKGMNVPTYVDCKVSPERWTDWADCMFPNLQEFERHEGLYSHSPCCLLIKRGPLGCTFREGVYDEAPFHSYPSKVRKVLNPTGAGDTAMAAFVVAMLSGKSLYSEACEFAMAASALAVEAALTHAPTLDEIRWAFPDTIARRLAEATVDLQ